MKKEIAFLWLSTLLISCAGRERNTHSGTKSDAGAATYTISPVYGDSVFFAVNSVYSDKIVVKGTIGQFYNIDKTTREVYFQRFVEKKNRFRKIHVIGTTIESVKTGKSDTTRTSQFDQYIEFDELGIFNGDPVDPISLIPLYPGRPVRVNEAWYPKVPVKIAMGEGVADFQFAIDSVYMDSDGYLLARIKVQFNGALKPVQEIEEATVTISGSGSFTWNCTINQRRDTHLSAVYRAAKGSNEVMQSIHLADSLIVYKEKWKF
jgi:hypothetical protein